MKILFLHGWTSVVGGRKPTFLIEQGHEVLNPALPDEDFDESVRIAEAEYNEHHPDVIVGSSRGGAVAMNMNSGDTPLVLTYPAWKKWGAATTTKINTTILHSRADDVVPFADSEELIANSGLPSSSLIEVGNDHRLADPEPLAKMLEVCERDAEYGAFIATVQNEIVPWIERRTIPFFHLEKDVQSNKYEDGIIAKDRTGVFIRIADKHYILTAAHHIDDLIANEMYCMCR